MYAMSEKLNKALIFSGGGTRLMIYLGVFAALEEAGMKPEVLIASCGGAFAATVINAFPDTLSRKDYLTSEEYYRFVSQTSLTKHRKLSEIGLFSLKKLIHSRNAPYIEDVFTRYLVEMNQNLAEDFPSLQYTQLSQEIPTVVIGSELLFTPAETGQKRNDKKLYQKIMFTDAQTAQRIHPEKVIIHSENLQKSAIKIIPKLRTDISMLDATRISISDMFYVAPALLHGTYFAGGAVDLIPVELARHLADQVIIEKKQSYSSVEEAFVQAVLGYSGNKRLEEIEQQAPDLQIDTMNIKQVLEGHYIKKSIDWKKFEIALSLPKSRKQFVKDQEKQWQYGFDQTMKGINGKFQTG